MSPQPGDGSHQTRADKTLQLDTFGQMTFQMGFLSRQRPLPHCDDVFVASIAQMDASAYPREQVLAVASTVPGTWFERWTLACGDTRLPFAVVFMPDGHGGTNVSATLME